MTSLLVPAPLTKITSVKGAYSTLEVARGYLALGERPIPVCDPAHLFVSKNHAHGYTRKEGTKVGPCNSPGKAPLEKDYGRFSDTFPSEDDLRRMFCTHRGNLGDVVPHDRIVVDVDPRNGGIESIDSYVRQHGPIPFTPTVLSGGGGYHYYFRTPLGTKVNSGGSLANAGLPGVEWKGPGGQVILPPSIHQRGRQYIWEPGLSLAEIELAIIPRALLELVLNCHGKSSAPSSHRVAPGNQVYHIQSAGVQKYFAALWRQTG